MNQAEAWKMLLEAIEIMGAGTIEGRLGSIRETLADQDQRISVLETAAEMSIPTNRDP